MSLRPARDRINRLLRDFAHRTKRVPIHTIDKASMIKTIIFISPVQKLLSKSAIGPSAKGSGGLRGSARCTGAAQARTARAVKAKRAPACRHTATRLSAPLWCDHLAGYGAETPISFAGSAVDSRHAAARRQLGPWQPAPARRRDSDMAAAGADRGRPLPRAETPAPTHRPFKA